MSEEVLAMLRATPERLADCTREADPTALRRRPEPEAWSAVEVLAHLRACADVWGGCIARILAEEHPTIRAVNPTSWIEQTGYRELDFAPSLRAFRRQRGELLALLEPLPPDAWNRSAAVTGAGRPLERTVLSYAQRLARHERPHVTQIARSIV